MSIAEKSSSTRERLNGGIASIFMVGSLAVAAAIYGHIRSSDSNLPVVQAEAVPQTISHMMAEDYKLIQAFGSRLLNLSPGYYGNATVTVYDARPNLSPEGQEKEVVLSVPDGDGFDSFGAYGLPGHGPISTFVEMGAAKPYASQTKEEKAAYRVSFAQLPGTISYEFVQGKNVYSVDGNKGTKSWLQNVGGKPVVISQRQDPTIIRKQAQSYINAVETVMSADKLSNN